MSSHLPPRFTEAAFRRYEDTIALAVTWQPTPYVFHSIDYPQAGITTVCRLRDAMRSLHDNKWETKTAMEKFLACYPLSVAQSKDGKKIAIYKEGQNPWNEAPAGSVQTSGEPLELPDGMMLHSVLAFLAQERALSRPLVLQPSLAKELQSIAPNYDIHLEPTPSGGAVLY